MPEERICLDPGFGFGKTVEHNLELLRRLGELAALGRPLLVGLSRKRTLGRLLGDPEAPVASAAASVGAAVAALDRGATIFRVHDVREHVEALTVAAAVDERRRAARPRGFGYHGVNEHEKADGQPFLYDLQLEVGDAGASDRIEDAVDYRDVAAVVRELSDGAAVRPARGARRRGRRRAAGALPAGRVDGSACGRRSSAAGRVVGRDRAARSSTSMR